MPKFALLLIVAAVLCKASPDTRATDVRADFLKLIDRQHVPAEAEWTSMEAAPPFVQVHFSFAADARHRVPGILLRRAAATKERLPVVITLHGTGGNKSDELPLMRQLAARGFIAVAIDTPYHGEHTKAGKGTEEYHAAILQAWHDQHTHPFFFDTVWDVMRLIDVLETRDDVDATHIGLYGVSKGGIETYLTAAVDTRVAAAIPCLGLQSFRWAIENNAWQSRISTVKPAFDVAAKEAGTNTPGGDFVHQFYQKVAPGIDGEFDGPAMAPLIAPRPLMVINGDSDPRTPLPGLKLCTDAAESAYQAAHASDHLCVRIQPRTGHKVNQDSQDAAVEWFVRWLKPKTADK